MNKIPVTCLLGSFGPSLVEQLKSIEQRLPDDDSKSKLQDLIQYIEQKISTTVENITKDEHPSSTDMCWLKEVREISYDVEDFLHIVHYSGSADVPEEDVLVELSVSRDRLVGATERRNRNLKSPKLKLRLKSDTMKRHQRYKPARQGFENTVNSMRQSPHEVFDQPMGKLISLLAFESEPPQFKVVSIFELAGPWKTVLARRLYHYCGGRFQRRAFLHVSRYPDTRRILASLLSQIRGPQPHGGFCDVQALSDEIKKHLQDQRYFIIVNDLWTRTVWDIIKHVFPVGNCHSRIIITTNIEEVALASCSHDRSSIYEMGPLISNVPSGQEEIREVIDLIYSELSDQLKTCLLYLNMYPEDYVIQKDDLMKQWVAENFVIANGQDDIETVSRNYFDKLVNIGIIEPVDIGYNGEVLSFTVHHMVHDLIACKSLEDNFICVLNYSKTVMGLPDKVRRLSLKFGGAKFAHVPESIRIAQVRSLLFSGFFKCVPSIVEYRLLRVLILCVWANKDKSSIDLSSICQLFLLKYMKIAGNATVKLPEQMQGLQFMETLEVDAKVDSVPLDIAKLKSLLHLRLPSGFSCLLPDGLLSLGYFDLGSNSENDVKNLGKLTNLQDLYLSYPTMPNSNLERNFKCLGSVMGKLCNLRSAALLRAESFHAHTTEYTSCDPSVSVSCLDALGNVSPAPTFLQRLNLSRRCCIFSKLPKWITELGSLQVLNITIKELLGDDIRVLSKLSSLTALVLYIKTAPSERIVFGNNGFSVLRYLKFVCITSVPYLTFEVNAMPNLQKLKLGFNLHRVDRHGSAPIIIQHLTSVKEIYAKISRVSADTDAVALAHIISDERNPRINFQFVDLKPKEEGMTNREDNSDLVTGVMSSLISKLGELFKEEYNLQNGVKELVRSLTVELEHSQAALRKVAQVPWDEIDEQVKLWAREVRESSYDMEDVLDTFLVRVLGRDSPEQKGSLKRLGEKMANLFKKSKARRKISVGVKDIMTYLDEVTKRCCMYKVDDIVAKPATTSSMVDPRLAAMYNKVNNLVGIDKSSSELISMLNPLQRGSVLNTNTKMKIVSVVGVGGLGKTTLAKAVYDKHKGEFDHTAFVPVGRNPDLKKVIQQILIGLDKGRYNQFNFGQFSEIYQFIDELKGFLLQNKRHFIVIDDIREIQSWDTIKLAIDDDNNCGGRIIVTTRKMEVATKAGEVYKLQPLPNYSSRELFYKRMYGDEGSHVDNEPDEISDKILKKCGGIPLAIITMASLLADKPRDKWYEIYKTIGFGRKDSNDVENTMMRILSFSYYDLPLHLRTCLLYLGTFLEDSIIYKGPLIWRWVAEGFIHEEQRTLLFETGEGYFNDLINRSLIQGVETKCVITGCRVHDIVLDFIRSMSHEENFFTILDNSGQDTPSKSPIRRLVHHNMTIRWHTIHQTVRSFSVQRCVIESWVPLFSFTFLRVLAIQDCHPIDGCCLRVEHVGKLLHLRYLKLSGTPIHRVPEEIGALRLLQTLDLVGSKIKETPSSSSLPIQLVCLRISLYHVRDCGKRGWVERLTSLEELFIDDRNFQWKELRSLRELRVLDAYISVCNSESMGYLSHLDKLQHLHISSGNQRFQEAASFVLPHQLRYFKVQSVEFPKLPPCINPSGLPHLSHLYLQLVTMDEQDLKNLGGLPELRFLGLVLHNSAAMISNINDSNVDYFPKLRCLNLCWAMVLFVANKVDKNVVSFHLWDGDSQIAVPFDSEGDELQRSLPAAAASDHENKEGGSIFIGEGIAAAPHHRFMPSLQVLQIRDPRAAALDHPYCMCDNLIIGWEYLSSLRKISVDLSFYIVDDASDAAKLEKVKEALRRAAEKHPNHPTLLFMEEEEEDGGDDNDDSSDDGGGNGDGDAASDDGDNGDDDGGNGDDGDDGDDDDDNGTGDEEPRAKRLRN